jgi:hypothetical protein
MAYWTPTKLRLSLPLNYCLVLKSYLHNRHFLIKVEAEYTELSPVNAGLHQGSVLGLLLYLQYTADLPTSPESITATFADNTAVLATDSDPAIASQKLQINLAAIQYWPKKWRIKANGSKLAHVFQHIKINVPPSHAYKQCTTPPGRICQISRAAPLQESYLAQAHFHKMERTRNHLHQNIPNHTTQQEE